MRLLRGIDLEDKEYGERRRLTVLFCDLVGSTRHSAAMDPEQWHKVLSKYQAAAARAIEEFGGYMGKYLGDGIMAYFGYPNAFEDSEARAVNAGLKIVKYVQELDVGDFGISKLGVRVGVHCGSVVLAPLAGVGVDVFGDVPNIAAGVQSRAREGAVLMTRQVRDLVSDQFEVKAVLTDELIGPDGTIHSYEAVSALRLPDKTEHGQSYGSSGFFGRQGEIDRILRKLDEASRGPSQLLFIRGSAGIGKTRLIEETQLAVLERSGRWISVSSRHLHQSSPFHGIAELLYRGLNLAFKAARSPTYAELKTALAPLKKSGGFSDAALRILASVMGVTPIDYKPMAEPDAEQFKIELLSALEQIISSWSERGLTIIIFEDIHWMDQSTLDILEALFSRISELRLTIISTGRPEFQRPWVRQGVCELIDLQPLSDDVIGDLVRSVLIDRSIDDDVLKEIEQRSDGIPLFAEALTQLYADAGTGTEAFIVPETLQDTLSARIDSVGRAKTVAQLASVIGRDFDFDLLSHVSNLEESDLKWSIAELLQAELIFAQNGRSNVTYSFTHALIREAAYAGLLKQQRKILHRRVAKALHEAAENRNRVTRPEFVAQHYDLAGAPDQSWPFWKRAARNARSSYSYHEAVSSYQLAIAAIRRTNGEARMDEEVVLLQNYIAMLQISKGFSAAETQDAMASARKIIDQSNDPVRRFGHSVGEWMAASSAGEYGIAAGIADQIERLPQNGLSPENRATAKMILQTARYRVGDLRGAEEAFDQGRDLFALRGYREQVGAIAQVYGNAAINSWILGDYDEAEIRIGHVCTLANESDQIYERSFSSHMAGMYYLLAGHYDLARGFATTSIEFAREGGFPQFLWNSAVILGRAKVLCGDMLLGIEQLSEGIEKYRATKSRAGLTTYLTWLSASQLENGAVMAALDTINEALAVNPDERYFRPETIRQRAAIHLVRADLKSAEKDLNDADQLARQMGASTFIKAVGQTRAKMELADSR